MTHREQRNEAIKRGTKEEARVWGFGLLFVVLCLIFWPDDENTATGSDPVALHQGE